MKKIVIAALTEDNVIGKDGDIPWHYPEDMKHFKEKTMGNPVIMGRKTFESLPEDYTPLPSRKNIVLTSSKNYENLEVETASNLDEAFSKAREDSDKVFIAGGESVYKQTLEDADKMILTVIHEDYEGDSYFPEFDEEKWEEIERDDKDELSFVTYKKK
ncbi:MAG: dihydrofolate reductase [Candidatus Nanohaloarchaea archaeon]